MRDGQCLADFSGVQRSRHAQCRRARRRDVTRAAGRKFRVPRQLQQQDHRTPETVSERHGAGRQADPAYITGRRLAPGKGPPLMLLFRTEALTPGEVANADVLTASYSAWPAGLWFDRFGVRR